MITPGQLSLPLQKTIVGVAKYLSTWQHLILHPKLFIGRPIESRKRDFVGPWKFYVISAALMGLASTAPLRLFLTYIYDVGPFSLPTYLPGKAEFWNAVLYLGLQTILWYVAFYRLLDEKMKVRTSTPFRRLFYEMLYIKGGPSRLLSSVTFVVSSVSTILITIGIFGLLGDELLDDSSDYIQNMAAAILGIILLSMWLGPPIAVSLAYSIVIARTLFDVTRRQAIIRCLCISIVSVTIVLPVNIYRGALLPQLMSARERSAVLTLHGLSLAHKIHEAEHGRTANTVQDLREYSGQKLSQPFTFYRPQFELVSKIEEGVAYGYRFELDMPGRRAYVHAVPVSYGLDTRYSFVITLDGNQIWGRDRGGDRASLNDKMVVDFYMED